MLICKAKECTGCAACMNVCPFGSISMSEDVYGETHPMIDNSKCVECGKCIKVCPNNEKPEFKAAISVYAAARKDKFRLLGSASGGIGAVLSEKWVDEGGIVCGTKYDDHFYPNIKMEDTREGIEAFKGSKYVQSDPGFIYQEIKRMLKERRKILFFGTPCQIAGLYSIVRRDDPNLVTVEILCHGVSPVRYFQEELSELRKERRIKDFDNITFRTNQWMLDFYFTIWRNGKPIYERQAYENRYFSAFLSGLSLRESCYSCHYKNAERLGDIMIGDFIGLGKNVPFQGNPDHKSLIICMTEKGQGLIERCADQLEIVERTLDEAVIEGRSLREPFPRHPMQKHFREIVSTSGFVSAANQVLGSDILERKKNSRKKELKRRFKLWMKYQFHIRIENKRLHLEK